MKSSLQNQWVRSQDGWLAGVCQGMGERFDVNPGLIRLIWLASVVFFGVGVLLYLMCAFIMPLEGNEEKALEPKFLGVCLRLSYKLGVDVVPLRIATIFLLLGSFGTVMLVYVLLHFLLPTQNEAY